MVSDREHMRAGLALAGLPAEAHRSGAAVDLSEGVKTKAGTIQ